MGLGNFLAGLAAVLAALLLAGQASLLPAKLGQGCFEIPRIGLLLARRTWSGTRSSPTSIPTAGLVDRLDLHVSEIAGEDHIPLAGFPLKSDGLDLTFDRSMQLDPDRPDVLDAEPSPR